MKMELTASQLIKLYMKTQVVIGNILYAPTPEARLLDALNGLADRGPVKKGKFLELSDVIIQHFDGKQENLKRSYINKTTIQLAVTLDGSNAGRGIGGQEGPKSYPYVEKNPVPVRIETENYIVSGYMYSIINQAVWSVLEDTLAFLPLTSAQITTNSTVNRENLPFVAVNKEHILSLQELDGKEKHVIQKDL
jgi:hypothetical protein